MHKTIYIDPDEEITNIVVKVRREAADVIYLVVPKNAMLVQGVINLEILRREVAKINKNIIFITNDKQTKNLLERLELDVREGLGDDFVDDNVSIEEEAILGRTVSESMREADRARRTKEIGSDNFYQEEDIPTDEIRKALVDDNRVFPNSEEKRRKKEMPKNVFGRNPDLDIPIKKVSPKEARRIVRSRDTRRAIINQPAMKEETREIPFQKGMDPRFAIRQKEAEKFFSSQKINDEKESLPQKNKLKIDGKKLKFLPVLIILFLMLGALGSWIFVSFPKVTISIFPKNETVNNVFPVLASSGATVDWENGTISGELEELEISHELRFDATGETFSSDKGKAHGKVKIINNYSASEQPLVVNTRVLSEGGKLFRLTESVTVPGEKDGQSGEIEAKVVADEPGAVFNIDASKFTIEGFKGTPKYEKFQVVSSDKMEGGLDNVDNKKVKMVTQSDIDEARSKVIDSFNNVLEAKIKEKIGQGKTFLPDSIEKEIAESTSSYGVGNVTDQFTFTLKQKIRLVTFYEDDVKNLSIKSLKGKVTDGYELNTDSVVFEFEKGSADFEKKELKFNTVASAQAWPKINQDEVKQGVAHRSEEAIKEFLQSYPNIKKVEIQFSPAWLTFLPITQRKIIIEEINK